MGSHGIRILTTTIMVAAVVGSFATTVLAPPAPQVISVDEYGHGINWDGQPIPWVIGPDPGPGGLPSALTYSTGIPFFAGDVFLIEQPAGGQSDVVRFNPGGTIVFYSDNADGVDALADTGFPGAFYPTTVPVLETGSEGANGADYFPTIGMPGYSDLNPGLNYRFVSDGVVPEPATMTLFAVGAVGTFLLRRKMKK